MSKYYKEDKKKVNMNWILNLKKTWQDAIDRKKKQRVRFDLTEKEANPNEYKEKYENWLQHQAGLEPQNKTETRAVNIHTP